MGAIEVVVGEVVVKWGVVVVQVSGPLRCGGGGVMVRSGVREVVVSEGSGGNVVGVALAGRGGMICVRVGAVLSVCHGVNVIRHGVAVRTPNFRSWELANV